MIPSQSCIFVSQVLFLLSPGQQDILDFVQKAKSYTNNKNRTHTEKPNEVKKLAEEKEKKKTCSASCVSEFLLIYKAVQVSSLGWAENKTGISCRAMMCHSWCLKLLNLAAQYVKHSVCEAEDKWLDDTVHQHLFIGKYVDNCIPFTDTILYFISLWLSYRFAL